MSVLEIRDLRVSFGASRRPAVDGVSLALAPGERLGLIGESGYGKSVTALAAMGLLPSNAHVEGVIDVAGTSMVAATERQRAAVRGNDISMIFQEPMTALDPTMRIGEQVAEARRLHHRGSDARPHVLKALADVGLPEPEQIFRAYPHELSGGQRQRVIIAMALVNSPQIVLCDEPTTALDVTVQETVLALLDAVLDSVGAACLFISHDLAVVARMCERIAVMWRGRIVEVGSTAQILDDPQHPYTRGLLATARIADVVPGERLPVVEDFFDGVRHD